MRDVPPLVVTPGEPGGIGSEIVAKAWEARRDDALPFFLIGDSDHFLRMTAGSTVPVQRIASPDEAQGVFATALPVLHRPLPAPATAGQFSPVTAPWVIGSIVEAVDRCLAGEAAAVVTCPIQKEALYGAGFEFQGHTDFLGYLARERGLSADDVMMLVAGDLRAVPVTVHIALKDVPTQLTTGMIVTQGVVVDAALRRYFGIATPRIAVTGLNPHAGENGAMGREDIETVAPAIRELQRCGVAAFGPLPADTAFHAEARAGYDAILCMYHDQALIPAKTLDFHGGVNVTLGLPFIRTSPDHGTALSLAGTGKARADSLIAALDLAAKMARAAV